MDTKEQVTVEKLELASLDVADQRTRRLKDILPEVFTEGDKIDFERLKLALGESVDVGKERYGMNWPGKADCFKTIQTPSLATLRPCPEESVNFDTTENLIIEGDNLEVLKLLQKSYLGKVKMIYIDPPYNTGNDFVYPDDYSESLQTYLEYTGQLDAEGRKFGTNTDVDGRFHSKWLTMMYTRLYLARNLLREDGVIFIAIDDGELSNLQKVCDEIFGEENFVGNFVINSAPNARDYGHIGKMHEYTLFYAKNVASVATDLIPEEDKKFRFNDAIGGFNVHPLYNSNEAFTPKNRPNLFYPFYLLPEETKERVFYRIGLTPEKGALEIYPPKSVRGNVQFVWRWGKEKSAEELNKEIIGYKTEEGEYRIVQKMRHNAKLIRSILSGSAFATRTGTAEVEAFFKSKVYPFPKPVSLVKQFLLCGASNNGLILDFFAGSGTAAQAVLELNKQDNGQRRFILVQLPEPTGRDDYKTITEITKERIRRVIRSFDEERAAKLDLDHQHKQDSGFRVFKLAESNFKPWDAEVAHNGEALERQMELQIDHVRADRAPDDILYEILLKSGFPLTTQVATLTLEGKTVYSVAEGVLLVCLERELTLGLIRAMAERKPERVVCLDQGFEGNDQLKTNAVQTFKTNGVTSFKTV